MMTAPRNVNDGSTAPPRLAFYGNEWGLMELPQLPHDREWSMAEMIDKLAASGFDGFQGSCNWAESSRRAGLRFCTTGRINTPSEASAALAQAADHGADCITLHVGWGMESDAEIDALVAAINEQAERYAVPAFIETHRATITQDIWRTCRLLERHPDTRINADYSHFYCGQEMVYRGFAITVDYLTPIMEHVACFHGRISDGECMQVDVGDGRENIHARNFVELWARSMTCWKRDARPGDLLPYIPELGPPSSGYSITRLSDTGERIELSDRWAQTLVLRDLAREAWNRA